MNNRFMTKAWDIIYQWLWTFATFIVIGSFAYELSNLMKLSLIKVDNAAHSIYRYSSFFCAIIYIISLEIRFIHTNSTKKEMILMIFSVLMIIHHLCLVIFFIYYPSSKYIHDYQELFINAKYEQDGKFIESNLKCCGWNDVSNPLSFDTCFSELTCFKAIKSHIFYRMGIVCTLLVFSLMFHMALLFILKFEKEGVSYQDLCRHFHC
ncbi:hypothetical protein TRFO_34520 [Tritrichomonas foetus]|uniref:Tetraspanin family protein n=1 Tax=Tritrichomonas foetus TaxID=1144522 RepID=A0A1J4JIZ0_9EUKA|nr:hypothetical protein TRFO_34520 [Tritrichomonas foetus]|eukprot:OHS99118.1 hypothetical protein TRFO_34520 [Tritrichomonas foetus]